MKNNSKKRAASQEKQGDFLFVWGWCGTAAGEERKIKWDEWITNALLYAG